jgi:hypothetical protein
MRCFIIMPFKTEFLPVRDMIREVVQQAIQATAIRADDIFEVGEVVAQVRQAIQRADFCVADVTGNNPNVMWEIGYARALEKDVVALRQHTEDIPFDIRTERFFTYSLSDLNAAKAPIAKAVKNLASALVANPPPLGWFYDELSTLKQNLSQCYPTKRRDLLSIVQTAVKQEGAGEWQVGHEERLMRQIASTSKGDEAQNAFWWLIAQGVLTYDQIDIFQYGGNNGWKTNLDLVTLSKRGAALLNHLK